MYASLNKIKSKFDEVGVLRIVKYEEWMSELKLSDKSTNFFDGCERVAEMNVDFNANSDELCSSCVRCTRICFE